MSTDIDRRSVFTATTSLGDIRLVGGRNQYEGRVEVFRNGEWQTVCDDSWDIEEAEVVCRQLRYGYAILAIQAAAFGQGSGGQWERDWSCTGTESSLDGCSSSSAICSHSEDASVICSSSCKCVPCQSPYTTLIAVQHVLQCDCFVTQNITVNVAVL